jgi:hypothetical protein
MIDPSRCGLRSYGQGIGLRITFFLYLDRGLDAEAASLLANWRGRQFGVCPLDR